MKKNRLHHFCQIIWNAIHGEWQTRFMKFGAALCTAGFSPVLMKRLAAASTFFFLAAPVHASDIPLARNRIDINQDSARERRIIRVTTGEWEPFVGQKLAKGGALNEIASELFKELGYKTEFIYSPWARSTQMLKDGDADVSSCMWKDKEREEFLLFGQPVMNGNVVFIKRKGDLWTYKGMDSLTGKRVGTLITYAYEESFKNAKNFFREDSVGLTNLLKKLESGRVDLAIEDELVLKYYLTKIEPSLSGKLEIDTHPIANYPCYFAVRKTLPDAHELLKNIDAQLRKIKNNRTYERIMKSHGLM